MVLDNFSIPKKNLSQLWLSLIDCPPIPCIVPHLEGIEQSYVVTGSISCHVLVNPAQAAAICRDNERFREGCAGSDGAHGITNTDGRMEIKEWWSLIEGVIEFSYYIMINIIILKRSPTGSELLRKSFFDLRFTPI